MKQSDKLTAYYFRAAQQIDTLYLDNQMQKLLYHASQNGIAALAAKGGERRTLTVPLFPSCSRI